MKKILGILVLGLLLGCAGGNKGSIYDYMNVGMTKEEWRYWTGAGKFFTPTFKYYKTIELHPAKWHDFSLGLCGNEYTKERARSKGVLHLKMFWDEGYKYFPKYKTEVISHVYDPQSWTIADAHRIKRPWYVFENVTRPINCRPGGKLGEYGDEKSNGILKAIVWSEDEALRIADPVYAKKVEEEEKREEEERKKERKKREEEERKILAEEERKKFVKLEAKHGGKCQEDGFVKGTTEYKDCIYEKEKARVAEEKKRKENAAKIVAGSGTAFFIDNNGHLVTNFHVVEKCYDQSKIVYKTDEYDTKLIAKDKFLDLAILKANVQNNKFIIISSKPPKKLKRIIVAGYPFGKDLSDDLKFNSGIITSLKGLGDDSTRIQIDAAVNPGNSGGPIVYEENGLLAAVAVAGLRKDITEGVNFGIKGSSLRNFLEANQLNLATIAQKFSFDDEDLAELLEGATVYTYCE